MEDEEKHHQKNEVNTVFSVMKRKFDESPKPGNPSIIKIRMLLVITNNVFV